MRGRALRLSTSEVVSSDNLYDFIEHLIDLRINPVNNHQKQQDTLGRHIQFKA